MTTTSDFLKQIKENGATYLTKKNESTIIDIAIDLLEKSFKKEKIILDSAEKVKDYLRLQLATEEREVFSVIFLDSSLCFLSFEKLFFGTINKSAVHPRIVVKRALELNAAAVILAHNHPSSSSNISTEDADVTRELKDILKVIDVKTLDHIIITKTEAKSSAESGLM